MSRSEWPAELWSGVRDWSAPEDEEAVALSAWAPRTGVVGLLEAAGETAILCLPAAGVVQSRPPAAEAASTLTRLRAAAGADGQAIVAAAPPELKASLDVWGPPPPGFPLMRALKHALDPARTLNPGRFIGGL
jgi:glycolate oxidase FAD binding subunit